MVRSVLRLEGLAVLAAAVWLYFGRADGSWVLFVVLILAPDLSMIGYARNAAVGAVTYNAAHNELLAVVVIVAGELTGATLLTQLGLILAAHVGMDRFMGYGLKYTTAFKDTHLQRV